MTGLSAIYNEAIQRGDFTLAFELRNGRGRFIFFMFFDENDKDSKDYLYLYLQNTNQIHNLKLYGSHRNGDFFIYFNEKLQRVIRDELQLNGNGVNPFNLEHFFQEINAAIPQRLERNQNVTILRRHYNNIQNRIPTEIIDEADKIYWLGFMRTHGTPRPQTLRKLYLYTDSTPEEIDRILTAIEPYNITLRWTNDPDKAKNTDFVTMMNNLNQYIN
ncbi:MULTISPECIES: hypothetical protein [Pasteurellaceae]|uniref:Uncharacterized protein n=1 Tax=Pasteurella atlantica TaxID=2827233 RepID=A0AAW8CRJ9_9PAST|nr:hypothetical protein [Pasteurella atlantica]MBR0574472.1 hypothetical protein [Pasteurella atlantica]MDP8180902.1 hypothetical protein [Pasteurella atlantica]MDP8187012.1 hypothetical protein [Pasteurella atlantica]MDP8191157.1 hypothetical protein [Pasteurella atlantica]QVE21924.1 hypothetical protein KGI96_06515 [Pasteurella atlantica]